MGPTEVVLGIDIGGTNTRLGYVRRNGNCLASTSIRTDAHSTAESYFGRMQQNAQDLFTSLKGECKLVGIGIGAPNANYYKGTIEHPPNLSWDYVDVKAEMTKFYDVPVAITNDANAAALGEMLFGAAQGMKDFIAITLGTGLGSGIVANGALIYGADGFAGEIGHTTVDPEGRQCGCGKRGCLEAYVSATGLCRTVQELICITTAVSGLRKVNFEQLTSKIVYEYARQGDGLALEAFEYSGRVLGLKLADSVAHLSPEAIVLLGGLATAGDLIFEPTKRSLEKHVFPIFRNKVKLLRSGLPRDKTAVVGASALIWNELERGLKDGP